MLSIIVKINIFRTFEIRCTTHYAEAEHEYLNKLIPGLWTGRRGVMNELHPRLTDLSALDLFLGSKINNMVYAS